MKEKTKYILIAEGYSVEWAEGIYPTYEQAKLAMGLLKAQGKYKRSKLTIEEMPTTNLR